MVNRIKLNIEEMKEGENINQRGKRSANRRT